MSLDMLKTAKKAIGIKQANKAIEKGTVQQVYIAQDADQRLLSPLIETCGKREVAVEFVPTMDELGKACGIDVGAAAVAVIG